MINWYNYEHKHSRINFVIPQKFMMEKIKQFVKMEGKFMKKQEIDILKGGQKIL